MGRLRNERVDEKEHPVITGIDHIVIIVRDLARAMDDYGRLGFTVESGGEHPGGTHNALVAFADGAYLELIAFKEAATPPDHPWYSALEQGEGLVAFALGSSDLAGDAEAIRARDLAIDGPREGSRQKPDGNELRWRNAGVGAGPRGRQRPFLIEDVTPRAWRVASGPLTRHANSVVGVVAVTLGVARLDSAASDIAALLGVPLPTTTEDEEARRITFATERGAIVVAQPVSQSGDLASAVAERGDHVFSTTLGIMAQGGEPTFEPDRAHGANLLFEPV